MATIALKSVCSTGDNCKIFIDNVLDVDCFQLEGACLSM